MGIKEISVSTEKSADEESFVSAGKVYPFNLSRSDMMVGENLG
jgi:hypothetical protein